jgi:hypothetical protein
MQTDELHEDPVHSVQVTCGVDQGVRAMFKVVVHHNQRHYAWERATLDQAIRAALDARRYEGCWVERITDRSGRVVVSRTELDALSIKSRNRARESA